jgi:hypothetical protein
MTARIEGLGRGVFVSNSEVGSRALKVTRFLYRYVCGNHIVWGASKVQEVSIRHIGDMTGHKARRAFEVFAREYADTSASDEEAMIARARRTKIAATKEEVLDTLFGKKFMPRSLAEKAFNAVLPEVDGDPKTVWGMMQGVTRVSQETQHADKRNEIDRVGSRLMAMVA